MLASSGVYDFSLAVDFFTVSYCGSSTFPSALGIQLTALWAADIPRFLTFKLKLKN